MADPLRVSLSEAAERLGVHYMTAYRYVRTGRLSAELHGARWTVAVEDLNFFVADQRTTGSSGTTSKRQRRLRDRMLMGDESGAWGVIEEALASGSEPTFIYTELLAPSLRSFGEEWEAGNRSIAEEHRATQVANRLVGRIGPRFARRGPSRGTIVLGLAPGDQHSLTAAVLSDVLRNSGFEPINLGADTPATSFIEMASSADRVLAVMVGATTSGSDKVLLEVVGALRTARIDAPILVGGRGVADEAHAQALGADGWSGHSALDALGRLHDLLAARTK